MPLHWSSLFCKYCQVEVHFYMMFIYRLQSNACALDKLSWRLSTYSQMKHISLHRPVCIEYWSFISTFMVLLNVRCMFLENDYVIFFICVHLLYLWCFVSSWVCLFLCYFWTRRTETSNVLSLYFVLHVVHWLILCF